MADPRRFRVIVRGGFGTDMRPRYEATIQALPNEAHHYTEVGPQVFFTLDDVEDFLNVWGFRRTESFHELGTAWAASVESV